MSKCIYECMARNELLLSSVEPQPENLLRFGKGTRLRTNAAAGFNRFIANLGVRLDYCILIRFLAIFKRTNWYCRIHLQSSVFPEVRNFREMRNTYSVLAAMLKSWRMGYSGKTH